MVYIKPETKKAILERCGGLSKPSKMPCYSYNIPATACALGSILREMKGSTCSDCYAMKGRYIFKTTRDAMQRRLKLIHTDLPYWIENMVTAIDRVEKSGFFRWHDSGDIQSMEHLTAINEIALRLPRVKFWLPTTEHDAVKKWRERYGDFAPNLNVRLSARMRGTNDVKLEGFTTSTVDYDGRGWRCPAPDYENQCNRCRACWRRDVKNVNYRGH